MVLARHQNHTESQQFNPRSPPLSRRAVNNPGQQTSQQGHRHDPAQNTRDKPQPVPEPEHHASSTFHVGGPTLHPRQGIIQNFFRWSSGCRICYWSSRDMGPAAFGGCRGVLVNPAHTTLPQHRHIYPTGRERFAARLTGSLRSVQVRCRSRRWRASGFCFGPHFFQSLLQVCRIHDRHEFDRHFGVSATCNQYTTRSAASYRVSFDSPTTRQIGSTNGAATTRARSPRACLPGGGTRCREPCCVLRWCWRCFGGAERMLPLNRTA